jgi:hypothetical protein
VSDGPKHPTWDGAETLDNTEFNRRANIAMVAFYLGRGFMEAPNWNEIGDDERFGWLSVIRAFDRGEIPAASASAQSSSAQKQEPVDG